MSPNPPSRAAWCPNPRSRRGFASSRAADRPIPSAPPPPRGAPRRPPAAWFAGGLLAALALSACGGSPPGGGGFSTCPSAPLVFSGRALYDDKTYDLTGFTGHRDLPVRYAVVEVRDPDSGAILGIGVTDAKGRFCASASLTPTTTRAIARVRADATVGGTRAVVVDSDKDMYYVDSAPVSAPRSGARHIPTVRIREDTPWKVAPIGGSASFAGGAFNILDVVTGGIQFVRGRWDRPLPTLNVMWQAQEAQGLGTFFVPGSNVIHVKGEVLEDSDEYDDDIILHEFGHYTLWNLSKDTSPGGTHYINGNTQDARLAWSEGWANFFSAMVRDVDGSRFSDQSGVRALIIDALFTEGPARSLRYAYEMATPEAFVPDETVPDNQSIPMDPSLFKNRVVFGTSEVSVAAALWDIYAGDGGVPGIGLEGIRAVIEEMRAEDPHWTTFSAFWNALETLYPAEADALRGHLAADRLLSLQDDVEGADDTAAQVDALTGPDLAAHVFPNIFPGSGAQLSDGQTLFPSDDVDLFKLVVEQPTKVRITTGDLNDGADTYLRLLADDGFTVLAENDNYVPAGFRFQWGTDIGTVSGTLWLLSYPTDKTTGLCGPFTVVSDTPPSAAGRYSQTVYACPPNAANRPNKGNLALGDLQTEEFLASDLQVDLAPGTYYAEVTRSPMAPPSTGPHGGYDLRVEGLPAAP